MSKYICVDDFFKLINKKFCCDCVWNGTCDECPCAEIIEELLNFPAADVEPVIHAKRIALDDCSNAGVYCSNCHKKVYKIDYSNTMKVKSQYCPNCGAKMDKE